MNNWIKEIKLSTENIFIISEEEILKHMPDEIKPKWENFMIGKTIQKTENGIDLIYTHDFHSFITFLNNE